MKKILIIIFGSLVALPAISQTPLNDIVGFPDTTNMAKGFVMIYPKPFLPQGEVRGDLFKVKWNKTVDLKLNTGGLINYQPESDQGTATHPKTMIRVLVQHIPMNADINAAELLLVQNLINEVVKPGVYVPPTTPTEPKPDIVTTIDDVVSDTRNVYTPTAWAHPANTTWLANFFNKTGSYYHVPGATLETSFDGYKIEWYTELKDNHGIAAVSIDGGDEVLVDLFRPIAANNSQLVWTSPTLTNGPHKIKIRITGNKTAPSTDHNIIHDYFKVYKKQ